MHRLALVPALLLLGGCGLIEFDELRETPTPTPTPTFTVEYTVPEPSDGTVIWIAEDGTTNAVEWGDPVITVAQGERRTWLRNDSQVKEGKLGYYSGTEVEINTLAATNREAVGVDIDHFYITSELTELQLWITVYHDGKLEKRLPLGSFATESTDNVVEIDYYAIIGPQSRFIVNYESFDGQSTTPETIHSGFDEASYQLQGLSESLWMAANVPFPNPSPGWGEIDAGGVGYGTAVPLATASVGDDTSSSTLVPEYRNLAGEPGEIPSHNAYDFVLYATAY
ncbi:MAG: hypothetical protein LBR20_00365 [Propionibacteriaceae bacterium]|jgi:hypothetical protein|nr:hypothetical protein [Propionibacteriaceae bacterium]